MMFLRTYALTQNDEDYKDTEDDAEVEELIRSSNLSIQSVRQYNEKYGQSKARLSAVPMASGSNVTGYGQLQTPSLDRQKSRISVFAKLPSRRRSLSAWPMSARTMGSVGGVAAGQMNCGGTVTPRTPRIPQGGLKMQSVSNFVDRDSMLVDDQETLSARPEYQLRQHPSIFKHTVRLVPVVAEEEEYDESSETVAGTADMLSANVIDAKDARGSRDIPKNA